jgi:hypothetical protein
LGGGLEYPLWQNWTIKAEYLYLRLMASDINFKEDVVSGGAGQSCRERNQVLICGFSCSTAFSNELWISMPLSVLPS